MGTKLRVLLVVALGLAVFKLSAASALAAQGVTVSPAYQQVSVSGGVSHQPVSFTITNDESVAQTFDLSAADFNTLGESGGLFFVGTNPTALQKKYGLAKWISLPQAVITLAPHHSQTIQAAILNLPDLAPGGHYGALMLSPQANAAQPRSGNSVGLHPIASSLIFVTKVGGDTHHLELDQVTAHHDLFQLPKSVTLRFHNDGNTHVIPRGVIKLRSGDRLISQGVINEDSNIVLPETYRQLFVPLTKINGTKIVGKYQLTVDFRFDGFDQYREYRSEFWNVSKILLVVTGLLIVGLLVLFWKRWRIVK